MANHSRTSELPYDDTTERVVLASMLVNPGIYPELKSTADDFYIERHRVIFNVITRLWKMRKPIDANTVADELTDTQLRYIGGPVFFTELLLECPEPTATSEPATLSEGCTQARKLREYRLRRQMLLHAADLVRRALDIETPLTMVT
jgi:replicative DNA helicase